MNTLATSKKMDEIRKFIDNISPMNNSDWEFFSSKLQEIKLDRNTPLLKVGKTENYLYLFQKE